MSAGFRDEQPLIWEWNANPVWTRVWQGNVKEFRCKGAEPHSVLKSAGLLFVERVENH
jgi:hypothetical protein